MATSGSPPSEKEKTNHVKVSKLVTENGRRVLQDVFDTFHTPANLHAVLNSPAVKAQLGRLRPRVLHQQQWDTLYPKSGNVESKNFDITLLSVLLRNICGLAPPPSTGVWNKEPLPTDHSQVADLVRIKICRNELYAHRVQMALTDDEFEDNWNSVEAALNRLSASKYKDQIERLKYASVDHEKDISFYALLQSWEEGESSIQKLDENLTDAKEEIIQEFQKLHVRSDAQEDLQPDMELYASKLKKVIIKRTDQQPMGIIDIQPVKTDHIFTNLVVYHEKRVNPRERNEKYPGKIVTEIKKCSEIFTVEVGEENPKRILLTGDPGIGKTMFSQKLFRDIAKNDIIIPGVKVIYLLPLRHFTNQKNDLNLQELLKRCPWLDKATMPDEVVINHIVENQQELLIIFDGFDEFDQRKNTLDNYFESNFSNDPTERMPVAALVAKILRKKMLENCRVILTTRPSEAHELNHNIFFEKMVKINGFSKNQILDYVSKYFSSYSEQFKKIALDKVKSTAHYATFGRIPFLCYLICLVLESEIKNQHDNSTPIFTRTQFYNQIVRCIEKNYNKQIASLNKKDSSLAVESTLDIFAKLAAKLVREKRFTFTTLDLEKLSLNDNESLQITSSNLLCCSVVYSNSPLETDAIYEYSFVHYSIQEFFVACHLVKMADPMAVQETTEMVDIFTSGLLGLDTNNANDRLMSRLLADISKQYEDESRRVVMLRCLYEFGQEKELTRKEILSNKNQTYWDSNGRIYLDDINDTDCSAVKMLVDISSDAQQPPHILIIRFSQLTCSGLQTFLPVLAAKNCKIIVLGLVKCQLDDECAACLSQYLPNSQITVLSLAANNITDVGVKYIIDNIPPKLTELNMAVNNITDECEKTTKQFLRTKNIRFNMRL